MFYLKEKPYHVLPARDDDLKGESLRRTVIEAQVSFGRTRHNNVDVRHTDHVRHPGRAHFQVSWERYWQLHLLVVLDRHRCDERMSCPGTKILTTGREGGPQQRHVQGPPVNHSIATRRYVVALHGIRAPVLLKP